MEDNRIPVTKIENSDERLQEQPYRGIGGWLILVAIGIIVAPILIAAQTYSEVILFIFDENFTTYSFSVKLFVYLELFANVSLFLFSCYLFFLFFKKSARFPKSYIIFVIINFLVVAADSIGAYYLFREYFAQSEANQYISESVTESLKQLVRIAIWVPYMLLSKRVKATFVQ